LVIVQNKKKSWQNFMLFRTKRSGTFSYPGRQGLNFHEFVMFGSACLLLNLKLIFRK